MPWDLISAIVGFAIQLFVSNKEKKEEQLKKWREFVEQKQSHAERSADLRQEYERQRQEQESKKDGV